MDDIVAIAAGAARSAFGFHSQHQRLMRLHFPRADGPTALLLPNRMWAHEEVSRCFRYEVELLSDDPRIALTDLNGKMLTISLVRQDGSLRYFNGYVSECRFVRHDGGFAFYRVVLSPWLAFARLRKDNVSFHGKRVLELTETIFQHYPQADWKAAVYTDIEPITCANQYDETDYNHLHRRWEALGLMYWYEQRADGHTLWLVDRNGFADPVDPTRLGQGPTIPFLETSSAQEDDAIHCWSPVRKTGSGKATLASFDYKNPVAQRAEYPSMNQQGIDSAHDVYENAGADGFRTHHDGRERAQQRIEELDASLVLFQASGNARNVQPGRHFMLGGHVSGELKVSTHAEQTEPSIASRRYLILAAAHEVSNNYPAGEGSTSVYQNHFQCTRFDVPWRPGPHYNSHPCTPPAIQSAIVTGPPEATVHTDGYGRIKVQFHWDRLGQYDENSSPWLRVMAPAAGAQHGHVRLPRVGEEVAVMFMDGNIDHPVVLGALHNALHLHPWKLPGQSALSGLRSREFDGDRANHLVLDDTPAQIQAQLRSDHQDSTLSLGYITRIDDHAGRKQARGEGWELHTDGHGVARAHQGILITTDAQTGAGAPSKEMSATCQRLARATELHEQLAKLAEHHEAQEDLRAQQGAAVEALKSQNTTLRGSSKDPFPELSEPHLVLSSPTGIALTSGQSTHLASERDTAISSSENLSMASRKGLFASVGEAFRLFVHRAGMKLVAASGKVTLQAQTEDVEIIASKVVALLSESDWVTIRGKKGVRIQGGQHVFEVSDTTQFFTSTPVLFHGNLETLPPKSMAEAFNDKSRGYHFDQEVNFVDPDGKPVPDIAYDLIREDGSAIEAKTSADGSTKLQKGPGLDHYTIRWKGELP